MIAVRRIVVGVALLSLVACASTPQTKELRHPEVYRHFDVPVALNEVPFFPQKAYQCGPAALATLLVASEVEVTAEELVAMVYLPDRQGSLQVEMQAGVRSFNRLSYVLQPSLQAVFKEVKQHRPVLVLQNLGLAWYPRWHYAVVVGYDLDAGKVLLRSGAIKNYSVSLPLFERTWQRGGHWAMVVLQPGEMPLDPLEPQYFAAIAALEHVQPMGDMEPAYRAGLEQWPQSQLLAMGLGNFWYRQGRKQEAASEYAAVIQQDPAYAPAHNNLAQVLIELGDREAAAEHARTAVMLGGGMVEVYEATLKAASNP